MSAKQTVKVQLVRSPIGCKESHRATVRGLGLRKLNSVSELQDTQAVRGIKPAAGAKHAKRRVGRGIGSGLGKTAGRGHKGQKSRSGGYHKVGFEGGQMPMQRRLPKRGFKSHLLKYNAEVNLSELAALELAEIDLLTLKQVGLVGQLVKNVKVIKSGELAKAVKLTGIAATAGAKAAIEAAGGSVA